MRCFILLLIFITLCNALPEQERVTTITEEAYNLIISGPIIKLLGEECYVRLFEEFDITNATCIKLLISKGLGLGIVIGGAIVKIPQIITILRHGSAKGLSLTSFLLETTAYEIVLIYNTRLNNPFSTFGEVLFMTIQNIIISILIVYFNNDNKRNEMIGLIVFGSVSMLIVFLLIPWWCMTLLYAVQIPIGLASKIPQITANYKNQSTGQLSVFAVLNYFAGTTARAFTTWAELDDPIMLGGNLLASVLNGVLVLQLIIYWEKKKNTVTILPISKAD